MRSSFVTFSDLPVQFWSVSRSNSRKMFAEDTSEVVDAAFDDFEWTTAVLLLRPWLAIGWLHAGVVEIYWVETDPLITGWFAQSYLFLRVKGWRDLAVWSACLTLYWVHILQDLQDSQSGARQPSHSWHSAYLCTKYVRQSQPNQETLPSDCFPSFPSPSLSPFPSLCCRIDGSRSNFSYSARSYLPWGWLDGPSLLELELDPPDWQPIRAWQPRKAGLGGWGSHCWQWLELELELT